MNKFLLLFFLFTLHYSIAQVPSSKKEIKQFKTEISKKITTVLEELHVPAASVAVVADGNTVLTDGYGYLDNKKKKATAESLFMIGSCSKSFTATLLGIVEEQNSSFTIDSKLTEVYPKIKFHEDVNADDITVQDALSHVSGLPRHDFSWYLFKGTKEEMLSRIQYHQPNQEIRKQWQYNNFMYLTAGEIAEEYLGKPWENLISDYFFQPLGMHTAVATVAELKQKENKANPFITYFNKEEEQWKQRETDYYMIGGMRAAGAISASAIDMSKWMSAWTNKLKDLELSNYFLKAITPYVSLKSLPNGKHPDIFGKAYGLGWFTDSYKGHFRVEHGGNIDGFSAISVFFPTDKVGIYVAVNQNGSSAPRVIANIISDYLLELEQSKWTEEAKLGLLNIIQQDSEEFTIEKIQVDNDDFLGKYSNPGYGTFEILERNDSLFASFPQAEYLLEFQYPHAAYPAEYFPEEDTFELSQDLPFLFNRNLSNQVESVSLSLESLVDPIQFSRKSKSEEELDYSQFTGNFKLGPQAMKVFLSDENELILSIIGQPDYTLEYASGSSFNLKGLTGYSVEFQNKDEHQLQFKNILFKQPNGKFTANRVE